MASNKGGAPRGNRNAVKAKVATNALKYALRKAQGENIGRVADTFEKLIDIWSVQIEQALEGDKGSAQMIVDRLEGKPAQSVLFDGDLRVGSAKQLSDDELANIAAGSSE